MAAFDVLMPVKNGMPYLPAALDGILSQSFADWRLIVLDHGSTDGSREVIEDLGRRDRRVAVFSFPEASGLSDLLNRGLALCDCRYVLRQDADDISHPDRMRTIFELFSSDPGLALVGSTADVIDASGRKIANLEVPLGARAICAAMLFRTPVTHPTVAMKLEAINRLGATYGRDFLGIVPPDRRLTVPGLAEDYFLFGQLAMVAGCRNIGRNLVQYRWHGNNVSAQNHLAQMGTALGISRYLAEILSIRHGKPFVDPAPFCNHGDRLFDISGRSNFSAEHADLCALLRGSLGRSDELDRELSFRNVVASRSRPAMAGRFARFMAANRPQRAEMRTVKSWLLRGRHKRGILKLSPAGLSC